MISSLKRFKSSATPVDITKSVNMGYQKHIKEGNIMFLGGKLLLFKPLNMGSKLFSLTIVPSTIIQILFDHYYSSPSGGCMGLYKTIYCLRMWFFWSGLREDIITWVTACAYSVSYNVWKNREHETHFSWPTTVLF